MAGRPTKWSQDLQDDFVDLLATGNYIKTACDAVGIGQSTYYRWMEIGQQDKDGKTPYRQFWQACTRAQARGETNYLDIVKKAAAEGDWRAASWYLERKFPDRWGRQDREPLSDWRNEVVDLLRNGKITPEQVRNELGKDLARELFESAGVDLAEIGAAEEEG